MRVEARNLEPAIRSFLGFLAPHPLTIIPHAPPDLHPRWTDLPRDLLVLALGHAGPAMNKAEDHFLGCLTGLAVGDAVGTTLEFRPPGTFQPIDDMVGGGPFDLHAGEWTDDTSMALCLAASLVEKNGFDPIDQLERYCRWQA